LQQLDALEAEEKQLTSQLEGITAQLNQVQSQNSTLAAQPPDDELEVILLQNLQKHVALVLVW
jgi:hypothetical protein